MENHRYAARAACASIERTTPRFHYTPPAHGRGFWLFMGALLATGATCLAVFSGALS